MASTGQRGSLQKFITRLTKQIERVWRWRHYEHTHDQNVLEHTMETTLLTQIVVALENTYGKYAGKLNIYRLLASAINHDLGEGVIGDVTFDIKNDPRVKNGIEEIEREKFLELFTQLGLQREHHLCVTALFNDSFILQDERDTVEGRLFNAIERLGYIIFALRELEYPGRENFVEVLKNSHEQLTEYCKEFVSIQILYENCLKEMRQLPSVWLMKVDLILDHPSSERPTETTAESQAFRAYLEATKTAYP